ncbi:unnamed protein product [Moneuplotes crassus]|uniref:Uncharacterized protein n=1 Tax=Euplotes crassus TaxID=5936 RepID=A0AAD1UFC8_EUPCR|nr:unnamed protein product [Moneuplotes crassus]
MILSLVDFIICCQQCSKNHFHFLKKFIKKKFLIPLKYSIYCWWPLSPLLGLNYLYPLCHDNEYKKEIKDSLRIRIYITLMHELIRSGGSVILQSYSLIEGTKAPDYLMIISITINAICFFKCKMIYCYQSVKGIENLNGCRKFLQYCIIIVETGAILSSLISITRYGKFWGLLIYFIALIVNIYYTMKIENDDEKRIIEKQKKDAKENKEKQRDNEVSRCNENVEDAEEVDDEIELKEELISDRLIIKDYAITMHDYICLICIRVFRTRLISNYFLEILQMAKISLLIGFCGFIYYERNGVDALIAIVFNSILLFLLGVYFIASSKDPQKTKDDESDNEFLNDQKTRENINPKRGMPGSKKYIQDSEDDNEEDHREENKDEEEVQVPDPEVELTDRLKGPTAPTLVTNPAEN